MWRGEEVDKNVLVICGVCEYKCMMCKEAATSNDDDEGMKEGEAVNTNKGEISGMEKERWSVNGGRVESGSL